MFRERIFLIITIIFSIVCCAWFFKLTVDSRKRAAVLDESSVNRAKKARASKSSDILVGVVRYDDIEDPNHMIEAIEIAKEQVNQSGLLGKKKLKIVLRNEQGDIKKARRVAQSFADNIDISFVIGHQSSDILLAVLPIYEFYGIVVFSPTASNPKLTNTRARYFFRNYPNDKKVGTFIGKLCKQKGWSKVVVMYPDNVYGRGVENAIEASRDINDVNVVSRAVFDPTKANFTKSLNEWKKYHSFDAIIGIFDEGDNGKNFIEDVIDIGFDVPLVLPPDLAELDYNDIRHRYSSDIYVLDVKSKIKDPTPKISEFINEFTKRTGQTPGYVAYNSYNALWAIAESIKNSGYAAEDVADYLRSHDKFTGVGGNFAFDNNGDTIKGIKVVNVYSLSEDNKVEKTIDIVK